MSAQSDWETDWDASYLDGLETLHKALAVLHRLYHATLTGDAEADPEPDMEAIHTGLDRLFEEVVHDGPTEMLVASAFLHRVLDDLPGLSDVKTLGAP